MEIEHHRATEIRKSIGNLGQEIFTFLYNGWECQILVDVSESLLEYYPTITILNTPLGEFRNQLNLPKYYYEIDVDNWVGTFCNIALDQYKIWKNN